MRLLSLARYEGDLKLISFVTSAMGYNRELLVVLLWHSKIRPCMFSDNFLCPNYVHNIKAYYLSYLIIPITQFLISVTLLWF